jgi:vacuolar-type H+-ATPase subunit E/Vma4
LLAPLVLIVDQDNTDLWKELCKQAQKEKDPAKLLALVQEIDRLLEARGEWLKQMRAQTQERVRENNRDGG